MKTYLKCEWIHEHSDEPRMLYSELSEERMELRKVDVYADGRHDHAGPGGHSGTTRIGGIAVPQIAEIAADPQFVPEEISRAEFEAVWAKRSALSANDLVGPQ